MSERLKVVADMLREEGLGSVADWLGRPDLMQKALEQAWEDDKDDALGHEFYARAFARFQGGPREEVIYMNRRDYEQLEAAMGSLVVSEVNRDASTITVAAGAPGPIEPGNVVRYVDNRPAPVRMAEKRARAQRRSRGAL
jgi:hypothetical protein